MNLYPRRFMVASLIYLMLGAVMGFLMGIDGSGGTVFRFMHIHFLFLGFMVMLMAGIAYHFVPRLRGGEMRWPRLIPIHFYMGNVGLVFKCIAYLLKPQIGFVPFAVFAAVTVTSLFLFAANLIASIPKSATNAESAMGRKDILSAHLPVEPSMLKRVA
jgi:cbb3-type cytochrome oxidase subunit 1